MQLFVKSLSGEQTTFDVEAGDAVQHLLKQIADRRGVATNQVHLIRGASRLEYWYTLAQCGVQDGETLAVVVCELGDTSSFDLGVMFPSYLTKVSRLGVSMCLCEDTRNGAAVAVKQFQDFTRHPPTGKRILRELRLMSALRHENLIHLCDLLPPFSPDFDDVYAVIPFVRMDLVTVMYSKVRLTEPHAIAFTCQILRGLKYLHSAGVVHRDLKPSAIRVNKDCTLLIGDFGTATGRYLEQDAADRACEDVCFRTRSYLAPESLLLPWLPLEAWDVWAAGCIHSEVLLLPKVRREMAKAADTPLPETAVLAPGPLFPGRDPMDMLMRIARVVGLSEQDLSWVPEEKRDDRYRSCARWLGLGRLPECGREPLKQRLLHTSDSCLSFVCELLDKVPTRRTSAADALAHPYLAHLHDPAAERDAPKTFSWDFELCEPTPRALKDRVYAECVRLHPEIVQRDAEWLAWRGYP